MLLSVPVAAVRPHHEHGGPADAHAHQHLMPPSTPTPTHSSSGGGAGAGGASTGHHHHHQHEQPNPARRVLRALLSVTRPRPLQRGVKRAHRPGQQQQHQAQRAEVVVAAAAPSTASAAASAQNDAAPAAPPEHLAPATPILLLHSAASLPPPSPPKVPDHHHHHHHRRRARAAEAGEEGSAAAPSTAAAAAASPPPPDGTNKKNTNNNNNPLRALLRLFLHHSHRAARHARPQGPGCNDATPLERAVNVLTSLPFLAVGVHVLRTRRAPAARRFGRSFVAVGLVAGTYHACPRGHSLRRPLRMLDYYSIAWSSSLLREAVGVKLPRWAAAVAAAATPVKPTVVTAGNLAVIELAFARAAHGKTGAGATVNPRVREAWRRHVAAAGVGIGCFLAEDVVVASGRVRFNAFHGVWHLLSASALGLANALLGHVEQALLLEAAEVVAEGEI